MLPTKDEISRAIEDVSNLSIPQLQGYLPCDGVIGPESYAGGFCIVFPFTNGYDKKAVRVWFQEIDRGQERYTYIANDFAKVSSRYLCDLRYYPSSLNVSGNNIDVVVMDWVKGMPLKDYIQSLIDGGKDTDILLEELAQESLNMFRELHSLEFSHGDLQHDNLIVTEYGRIKLVDYDSFYTPSLGNGFNQTTTGYSGYQHPARFQRQYESNEKVDYFSELIIYMSLKALSKDISLWKYAQYADFSFLFSSDDFADIEQSPIYSILYGMGEEMQILLRILKEYLNESDLFSLEPFEVLYNRYITPPNIISFDCENGKQWYVDDEIILSWSVENATKITLNGKDVSNISQIKKKVGKTDKYVLKATNGIKTAESTICISIFEKPCISFKLNKTKLRIGKESEVRLTWSVKNALSVFLKYDSVYLPVNIDGNKTIKVKSSTDIWVVAVGLDGQREFSKLKKVYLFNESSVTFVSDKQYSLPSVPVQLSWNVDHSKEVELVGFGKVNPNDTIWQQPEETTIYTLKVTDAFGTKEYPLKIQMLPLPKVKIFVPSPGIENQVNINLQVPIPTYSPPFPNVNVMGVELSAPYVPSLTDSGIDIKLSSRIEKQINLWVDIKSLYTYYRNKILSYER